METTSSNKKRNASLVSKSFVSKVVENLAIISAKKHRVSDVKVVAEAFVNLLVTSTSNGESITFTNLFTFKRALRENRTHKNPRDNTPIFKPAHYVLTMEVKPQLKEHFGQIPVVNGSNIEIDAAKDPEEHDEDKDEEEDEIPVNEVIVEPIEEAIEEISPNEDVDGQTGIEAKKKKKSKVKKP